MMQIPDRLLCRLTVAIGLNVFKNNGTAKSTIGSSAAANLRRRQRGGGVNVFWMGPREQQDRIGCIC
jgi:hypothetical protein